MNAPEDPLSIDIRRDLEKVDEAMSAVLASPDLIDGFVKNPSLVAAQTGLHPDTSPEIHERTSQIFYAVLANRELVETVLEHFSTFEPPQDLLEQSLDQSSAGLERGALDQSVELDMLAVAHFFNDPDVVRRVYRLALYDLNQRGLLAESHSEEEIDDYVERLVEAIQRRAPLREIEGLERWDENYGVDRGYGAGLVEVGIPVTLAFPVEVLAPITVVVPVFVVADATTTEVLRRVASGDPGAVRKAVTAGALFRLAGDVMTNVEELRG